MFEAFKRAVDRKETSRIIGHAFWSFATKDGQEIVVAAIKYLKRYDPDLAKLLAYEYARSYM